MKKRFVLAALFAVFAATAADTPINLVQQSDFKPVVMHGRETGAFGWFLLDGPRYESQRVHNTYVSGDGCFELKFADGAVTFAYPDPLNPAYAKSKRPIVFSTRVAWPAPPAPKYLTTARVKFDRGKLELPGLRRSLKPAPDWQEISVTATNPFTGFSFRPEAGSSFSFAKVKSVPVYPAVGGEIALPDGGKLTRFLLPENADYMTRWGTSLWRGWLWKLTGVALPIETVKEVKPTPGAFVLIKGKAAPGGWHLVVDKAGIVLTAADERALSPALFDYLRLGLGCAFYAVDCRKVPKDGSVRELAAIDRTAKPKFQTLTGDDRLMCLSGAYYLPTCFTHNDCDYFHLANPQNDHILNTLMPVEMYFDKHPEYYMLDRFGKRVKTENPYQINPCFSSREGMRIMADNLVDYAKGQSLAKFLVFSPGDAFTLCLCPECIKFNGGRSSNSDSQIEFANRFMPKLAKVRPDMTFIRSAYASHHELPTHVKIEVPNIGVNYCLGHDVLPCTLHVDCAKNRKSLNELAAWAKLAGGAQNLSFDTYRDVRPLHHLKQMEYVNRFGNKYLYIFIWKGYSPATAFTTARWNLGEDPEKLLAEFDNAYYGKGGKFIHEINLLVEKFAENYRHTPEELNFKGVRHFCIWGGDLKSKTLLDRKTFDAIYALFDKALEAAKDDPLALRHILKEKKYYLAEDLIRYNRASCASDAELAAFAARLADLIRCARRCRGEYANIVYGESGRNFVTAVSGWEISDSGKFWADEPEVEKFLADPAAVFKTGAEKIPGGWYFKPGAIKGANLPSIYNYQCPPRMRISLERPSIKPSSAVAVLPLAAKPAAPLCLAIEGLDDDKAGASLLKVEVNGRTLFEGPNGFKESEWSRMTMMIPAEYLKAGDNEIRFSNVTPDVPSRSVRYPDDPEKAKSDGQWGWLMISELIVFDPAGDFAAFADGAKDTRWRQDNGGLKAAPGKIVAKDGKVVFTSGAAPLLHLAFFRSHREPKIPVMPGAAVRVTVEASGKGKLLFRLPAYLAYDVDKKTKAQKIDRSGYTPRVMHYYSYKSPEFELSETPKTITHTFKVGKNVGQVYPEIVLSGPGAMTVTKFDFELLPPANSRH